MHIEVWMYHYWYWKFNMAICKSVDAFRELEKKIEEVDPGFFLTDEAKGFEAGFNYQKE